MIDGRWVAAFFHSVLLAYLLVLLSSLGELSGDAQFFPYLVGALIIPLVVVELVRVFLPSTVRGIEEKLFGSLDGPIVAEGIIREELETTGWIIGLFALTYVFGLLVGVFFSTFAYIAREEHDYRLAFGIAAGVTVSIFVLLTVVFDKILWSGIVGL